jgi:hypothetical protein
MNTLQIYRDNKPHLLVNIDGNTLFSQVVMGEHVITTSFITNAPFDIDEGDYVLFRGNRFTINESLPPLEKSSSFTYKYDLEFEGFIYDLIDKVFTHLGSIEFSFFGTPLMFIQLIVDCMNTISTGWTVGEVDTLEEQLLDFYQNGQGFTCKAALSKIAEAFKLEFWLTGKTINLTKQAGVLTNLDFEYGRGKGLYKVIRGKIDNPKNFNRILGAGGTKNIPADYRGGTKRLVLPEEYLEIQLAPGKRRKEGSVVFDDIYPKRTGTLTGVSSNWLKITDTSIDFDINALKIDGSAQQVSFVSGEVAGKDFTFANYDHSTKTITIEPLTDSDGYVTPNSTFEIKTGDKYILIGIAMPLPYVTSAEDLLRTEMQKLLNQVTIPPYSVEIDEKYMRDNGIQINAGDRVRLKDAAMGIDMIVRVLSVKFPLVNENQVTIVLSNDVIYTNEEKAIVDTDKIKKTVTVVDRRNAEKARSNSLNMRKLQGRIFNPDGTLFEGQNSIVAGMGAFGYDSQNFGLVGVTISTNPGADKNSLNISQGKLIHYIYKIDGLGYDWAIDASEWQDLDPLKYYYVYAKCSKTSLSGQWMISEIPVSVNDITGFYAFNVGQLYEVNEEGYRGFDFTKGMTYIVGDTITSGRIQDITKQNYLDLNTGQFNLGDSISGLDWGITAGGQLTIRGQIIATTAQFIDLVVQNLNTKTSGKRVSITESDNNIRIINALEQILIEADDDSAREGIYWNTAPPLVNPVTGDYPKDYLYMDNVGGVNRYYYSTMGPGISIGVSATDSNGFSSVGRKEIRTNGKVVVADTSEVNKTEITKNGIAATGDVLAATGFKTKDSGGITKSGGTGRIAASKVVAGNSTPIFIDVVNGIIVGWGDGV